MRRSLLASLPGIALALLPKFTCPACWPMWASVFPSLGLGLVLDERFAVPLLAVFLLPAVAMLAIGARRRRGHAPFAVGLVGAALVVAARSGLAGEAVERCGLALFVGASVWNAWPRRGGAGQ